MPTPTIYDARVRTVLDRLFAASAAQETAPPSLPEGFSYQSSNPQQRADAMSAVYMPVSASGGELLYSLVRATRPETIIEFGTSFGISTIYLASAVLDNGTGHVYSTELSATKVAAAQQNLSEAGVTDQVTILLGDALQTLKNVPGPIGIVLLDGWKDMNLPLLRLLEPRLGTAALVACDDSSFESVAPYLAYVRNRENGYVSVNFPVADGMEISCWSGVSSRLPPHRPGPDEVENRP